MQAGKFGTIIPNTDWRDITGETCDMHVEESLIAAERLHITIIQEFKLQK